MVTNSADLIRREKMTAYVSRSYHQMAAIFSCDKCSAACTSPADLDHHRQIHDFGYDADRTSTPLNSSRSRSMTIDQARAEQAVGTPAATTRCFFFCSTCNTRVESLSCLKKHSEQCRQPTSIPESYTPQSPHEIPSPELSWSPGSDFETSTSWQHGIQIQGSPPANYSPPGAVQSFNSHTGLATTALSPQYVALMPPIPTSNAMQTSDISWIDFLVPIERGELHKESTSFEDPSFSPLSDQFWRRPVDTHLKGYHFPDEVLAESLESLRVLFDAGGIPSRHEAIEEQKPFLPAINLLNQLCANYFSCWQPNQPVFHFATWSSTEYPMALVSAMACVGSIFTQDSQILQQASYINDRCTLEINRLVSMRSCSHGLSFSCKSTTC
jgi:hypothetical protein